jgi:phage terminase Nu1 subunit (DNA packaging protein)
MSGSKTKLQKKLAEIEKRLLSSKGPRVSEAEGRRRRIVALAELREVELRKKKGELMEADKVVETLARISSIVRDSLLSLPERIAGQVAALTDERQVRDLLASEVRKSLSHLSQKILDAKRPEPPAGKVN